MSTPAKHVLVVDDDPFVLTFVQRSLEQYRVTTMLDPREAVAFVAGREPLDLLITDYFMPGITGDAVVARARECRPDLKVLVLTGYSAIIEHTNPTWWRTVPHLDKPFSPEHLRTVVEGQIGAP